jgi:signal transduction histidine kinase
MDARMPRLREAPNLSEREHRRGRIPPIVSSTSEAIRVAVPERSRALSAAADVPADVARALVDSGIEVVPTPLEQIVGDVIEERGQMVLLDASAAALKVCRGIKSSPHTHFVPVLVLAPNDREARLRAYQEGADHVIVEAVDADELASRAWALVRTFHIFKMFESRRVDLKVRRDWARYLIHDLGNSLARVTYNIFDLRRRLVSTDPEALGPLSELELSVERSVAMLRDVLDVDRLRRGRLPIRQEPVPILDLVRRVAERFEAAARELQIAFRFEGDEVRVKTDRQLAERIVANLIDNAIRFSPAKKEILVAASSKGAEARLVVVNHGPPVPVQERERIFLPFARLDQSAPRAGTGLGLAFVRMALEAQGGKVCVEDAAGGGAAFVVTLPVAG